MKNALILHGTDFDKSNDGNTWNWYPWLKQELEKLDFQVSLPLLPEAWHPDFDRYWPALKDFDYNDKTVIIGHSSGMPVILNLLQTLAPNQKVKLAISVAGFYKDEGWNCGGLFK